MILLVITLLGLSITSYYLNNRNLVSPAFLLSTTFFICSLVALINQNKWQLILNRKTYLVICGAILEFIIVTYLVNKLLSVVKFQYKNSKKSKLNAPYISTRKSYILFAIQLLLIIYVIRNLKEVTKINNIFQAASALNQSSLPNYIGQPIALSKIANIFLAFILASGLYTGYVFFLYIIVKKNFRFDLFINMFISILAPFVTGSRGNSIYMIISWVIYCYLILWKNNKLNFKMQFKFVMRITLVLIILLLLLPLTAVLFGRRMDNWDEYLSIYIGAQIKNLNEFILNNNFPLKTSIFGHQTYFTIIPLVSKLIGLNIPSYKLDLPYQAIGSLSLGNVYTTFYPWLYDFGYKGVFLLTLIMAIVVEFIYHLALHSKLQFGLSILLYGYLGSFVALLFFSNKFYEGLNSTLILIIMSWILLIYIFKQKKGKIK